MQPQMSNVFVQHFAALTLSVACGSLYIWCKAILKSSFQGRGGEVGWVRTHGMMVCCIKYIEHPQEVPTFPIHRGYPMGTQDHRS